MKLTSFFKRARAFRAAFQKLYGEYVGRFVLLAGLGFVNGLLGVLGVTLLIPLFSLVANQDMNGSGQWYLRYFQDFSRIIDLKTHLTVVLIVVVTIFIIKAIVLYFFDIIGLWVTTTYELALRKKLYRASLDTTWPYLLQQRIGLFENIIMGDVGAVVRLMSVSLTSILNITTIIMYLAAAITLSPFVTLVALGIGGLILILFRPLLKRIRAYARTQTQYNKDITHEINENSNGMKVIKAAGVEEEVSRMTLSLFSRLQKLKMQSGKVRTITDAAIQPLSIIFITSLFGVFYRRPDFNFAAFVVIIYLIQQVFLFIERTQDIFQKVNELIPFTRYVVSLMEQTERYREVDHGDQPFILNHTLAFRDVTFRYAEAKQDVFDRISFRIEKGKTVGIIGPSGAGKTTLVDLLLRLFEPQSGAVLVDGNDSRDIRLKEWRRNISYVPQDIFLKNDTVANNIRFYDTAISGKEIQEAAQAAQIYDFVSSLPKGFETVVGDRGVLFSAGQRQRIVLARSLVRRPAVLILDEATSALDVESELLVKQALDALRGRVTIIIIAHRLSTIQNCDKILVLEGGRVKEEGEPRELLKDKETYFHKVHHIQ